MQHRKSLQSEVYTEVHVPFSWEAKPGVCKVTNQASGISITRHFTISKLPPPPTPPPPPPHHHKLCTPRHSVSRTGSFRIGVKKDEPVPDPFLAAYERCTKSPAIPKSSSKKKKDDCFGKRKIMLTLSCKDSCHVWENNLERIARPVSKMLCERVN